MYNNTFLHFKDENFWKAKNNYKLPVFNKGCNAQIIRVIVSALD